MALLGDISVRMGLDVTDFQKGLKDAESNMSKVGKNLTGIGKSLVTKVSLPLLGVAVAGVKVGADFEQSMAKVSAVTNATSKEMGAMEEEARKLGKSTKYSANEVADGMTFLGMAGFKTGEIVDSMGDVLNLASISGLDLATTADIASNMLSGMGMDAKDLDVIIDSMAYTMANSNTDMMQLGDAFTYVAPVASDLGVDLAELSGAIGFLGDAGIQGGQAGRILANGLTRLAAPTDGAKKLMKELGIEAFDAEGNLKSMPEVISELEKGFKDLNPKERAGAMKELFGMENAKGWSTLMAMGSDELERFSDEIRGAEGAGQKMADVMNDTLYGRLNSLKSMLADVGIEFYNSIEVPLKKVVEAITRAVEKFSGLDTEMKNVIIVIGAVATVIPFLILGLGILFTVIGKTIWVFNKVVSVFRKVWTAMQFVRSIILALSGPIGWVILSITALIAIGVALYKNWDEISAWAVKAWGKVKDVFKDTMDSIVEWVSKTTTDITKWFSDAWTDIIEGVSNFLTAIGKWFSDSWKSITDGVKDFTKSVVDTMASAWESVKETVVDSFTAVKDFIVEVFTTIVDFIVDSFNSIISFLSDWGSKMYTATGLEAFVDFAVAVFDFLYDTVTITMEMLSAMIGIIWNEVLNFINPIIQSIVDFMVDSFNKAKDFTVDIFTAVHDFLIGVWQAIHDFVYKIASAIVSFVVDKWYVIWNKSLEIFNAVKAFFTKVWNAIYKYISGVLVKISNYFTKIWTAIKTLTSVVFSYIKNFFTKTWNSILSFIIPLVNTIWNTIKKVWDNLSNITKTIFSAIKMTISNRFNEIKDKISTTASNIFTTVKDKFNAVKDAMIKPVEKARDKIKEAVDKVKSFFTNMKLKFPMPSMPSFSVSRGEANFMGAKVPVPKFKVKWNAKGNIFNGASILGGNQGVGEAGAEVVMPIQRKRYMKPYASMVAELMADMEQGGNSKGDIQNVFEVAQLIVREEADVEKIAKKLEDIQRRNDRAKGRLVY